MEAHLARYADLILDVGLGFRSGQCLAIDGLIEHVPLARALAEGAYRRGARYVDVWYFDSDAKASRIRHADEESLMWTPPWLDRRYHDLGASGGALVRITGDPNPDRLRGLDAVRAGLDRMPAIASRLEIQLAATVSWTVVGYPTREWARQVFGQPDVERLWRQVEHIMRLDQPDPVDAWHRHMDLLQRRADQLSRLDLDTIRFEGPGTDLRIGLIPHARWATSRQTALTGQANVVNLPTEEVFTAPDPRRAEGTISCTRPLMLGGVLVEGLQLTLAGGRIVDVRARAGQTAVESQLTVDAGARRLGEVALVDASSTVAQTGVTYWQTLLDENATCHLAWGAGIPNAIVGWEGMSAQQLGEAGVNQSTVHTDVMVGGPEVTVTGHRRESSELTILTNETWQLTDEQVADAR